MKSHTETSFVLHQHKLPERCFCRDLQRADHPVGTTLCVMGLLVGVTKIDTATECSTSSSLDSNKMEDEDEDEPPTTAQHEQQQQAAEAQDDSYYVILDDESGAPAILPLPAHMSSSSSTLRQQLLPGVVVECHVQVVRRPLSEIGTLPDKQNASSETCLSVDRLTVWPPRTNGSTQDDEYPNEDTLTDGMQEFQWHILQILHNNPARRRQQQQDPQEQHLHPKQPSPYSPVDVHPILSQEHHISNIIHAASDDGGISLSDLSLILGHDDDGDGEDAVDTEKELLSTLESLQLAGQIYVTPEGLYRPL